MNKYMTNNINVSISTSNNIISITTNDMKVGFFSSINDNFCLVYTKGINYIQTIGFKFGAIKPMFPDLNKSNAWLYDNYLTIDNLYSFNNIITNTCNCFTFIPKSIGIDLIGDYPCIYIFTVLYKYKSWFTLPAIYIIKNIISNLLVFYNSMSYIFYEDVILSSFYKSNIKHYITILTLFIMLLGLIGLSAMNMLNTILLMFTLINLSMLSMSKQLLFLLYMFSFIGQVNATITPDALHNIYIIICLLGNLLYMLLLSFYNYLVYRTIVKQTPLLSHKRYNYLFNGFIYLLAIQSGIFSSNCFYFLTSGYDYGPLWFILSGFVTVLSATTWNNLQYLHIDSRNVDNLDFQFSVMRSLFEALCFNAVAWNTYFSWNWLLGFNFTNVNIISLFVGFLCNIIFSFFTIMYESSPTSTGLTYGLCYLLSFTSLAFSSNGLVAIIAYNLTGNLYLILLAIFCGVVTVILHPSFYRSISGYSFWSLLVHVITYYFLFSSFVITGWVAFIPLSP